jgi:hypothetical protein
MATPYCAAVDVQAEIQTTAFTTTTKPTLAQVEAFCSEVSADMDAKFQAIGAVLPFDNTEVLAWCKLTATFGVCARAFLIMGNYLEKHDRYKNFSMSA